MFGARIEERYTDDPGRVVHAAFSLHGAVISLTEERRDWNNDAPASLGGSAVILNLVVTTSMRSASGSRRPAPR